MVAYHSSNKEFNIFEKEKISENFEYSFGFHFSNDIEDSKKYGKITKSFFLKIINPFVFNVKDNSNGSVFIDMNRYEAIHEIVKSRKSEKEIDGVIAYSSINGYVIMYSNQIKLADGTNTTFAPNNDDIRFNEGGKIENELSIIIKGVTNENKYKGNYKKIFDLIEENTTFYNPYGTSFEELKNNDFYIIITPKPEFMIIEKISKLKGVEIINSDIRFETGGNVITNPTEIECHRCDWKWKVKDGGDDLFICHKCNYDNSKYYKFSGIKGQKLLKSSTFGNGGLTVAKTPAPKSERIYGSSKNPKKSSSDSISAEKIQFDKKTLDAIKNKVAKHNEEHPNKKVTIASAKAVVRRGLGAYSSSHRPTISGGKPNSRVAWGLARLNAFLYKVVEGESKSGKYSQDNDLLDELGIAHEKFKTGGTTKNIPKKKRMGDCYLVAGQMAMGTYYKNKYDSEFIGIPYLVHAEVVGQGAIEGIRYGHAWVEDDVFVYDFSNGRELTVPKALYYQMGQIIKQQPKYFRYTFEEATKKMVETKHYGSWDLITKY